jgi:hypothetical protein
VTSTTLPFFPKGSLGEGSGDGGRDGAGGGGSDAGDACGGAVLDISCAPNGAWPMGLAGPATGTCTRGERRWAVPGTMGAAGLVVAMAGAARGRGTGSGAAIEIACAEAGAWPVRSDRGRARSAAGLPPSDESDEGRAETGTTAATGGPATGALARRPARRAAVALSCAEAVGRAGLVGRGCRVKPVGTSGG